MAHSHKEQQDWWNRKTNKIVKGWLTFLNTQTNTKALDLNRTLFKTKHQTNQRKRYCLFCPQYLVYKVWSMQCIHASCFKIQSSSSGVPKNTQIDNKFNYTVNNFSRMNSVEEQTNDYWENIVQSRRLWITSGGAWWWWCIGIGCTIRT